MGSSWWAGWLGLVAGCLAFFCVFYVGVVSIGRIVGAGDGLGWESVLYAHHAYLKLDGARRNKAASDESDEHRDGVGLPVPGTPGWSAHGTARPIRSIDNQGRGSDPHHGRGPSHRH